MVIWLAVPVTGLAQTAKPAASDDGGLDFTKGDLAAQTIGPIKAEAEKPQVMLMQVRIAPEFRTYELTERSFVQEVLGTATHQQLDKKFRKKTFRIEVPNEKSQ
jgi:hypothetical protein